MKHRMISLTLKAIVAILPITLLATSASAGTYKVLYSFKGGSADGAVPFAGLVVDKAGNLYGTTEEGGGLNYGTVFELGPVPGGGWTETVIHQFDGKDGLFPVSGLTADASDNLYGAASGGGTGFGPGVNDANGVAFELTPTDDGKWKETVLHTFTGIAGDGIAPESSLVFDSEGNLYGATVGGGDGNGGIVFKLSPAGGGEWTETVVYAFGQGADEAGFGPTVQSWARTASSIARRPTGDSTPEERPSS